MATNIQEIVEELPAVDSPEEHEHGDEGLELTDEEAELGDVVYHEVDDLDDYSTGLAEVSE